MGAVLVIGAALLGTRWQLATREPPGPAPSAPPSTAPLAVPGAFGLVTTGDDLGAVTRSYVEYQMWLLEHPDPDLVDVIYQPGTERLRELKAAIGALARQGRRFDCDPETEVLLVEPDQEPTGKDEVIGVLVHTRRGPCRLLEADGTEVGAQPGYARSAFRYTFGREGGRWYLVSEQELGDA